MQDVLKQTEQELNSKAEFQVEDLTERELELVGGASALQMVGH